MGEQQTKEIQTHNTIFDDATMAIRMVEYDFSIALEQAQKKSGRKYEIDFPASCVLYLRCGERTPDRGTTKFSGWNSLYL